MATPTLEFSDLSLPDENPDEGLLEDMPSFEGTSLEERKVIVRDIIASFDDRQLPSELFNSEYLDAITQAHADRPDWRTIHDSLGATLMQWCCHDKAGWVFINRLHSSTTRALLFSEKVERRLQEQIDNYDTLASKGPVETASQVNAAVVSICQQLDLIVREVGEDIRARIGGQYNAARILLHTLELVCKRNVDLPTARRSGRRESEGSVQGTVPTLYRRLVGNATHQFILNELESVQQRWPRSLATRDAQTTMRTIRGLLEENGAPNDYLTRFQALLSALVDS